MQVPVDFVLATNIFYVASTGEMKLPPFCIPLRRSVYLYAFLHTFTPLCIPLRLLVYPGTAGVCIYPHIWISNIAFELLLVPILVVHFSFLTYFAQEQDLG
jgi:hypothetical protein